MNIAELRKRLKELRVRRDEIDIEIRALKNLLRPAKPTDDLKEKPHPLNTSGERGVSLHKCGKWRASLYCNGRQVYHKLFSTKEEAAIAYAEQRRKYHGYHEKLD
jgi:hypothetical protein